MQAEDYRNKFGISQSAIKDFKFKTPKRWKDIWIDKQQDLNKNEDNFVFGSLLDTLLFTPSELEKRFYVGEEVNPTKAIESIIRSLYNDILSYNERVDVINSDELPVKASKLEISIDGNEDLLIKHADSYVEKTKDGEKKGWNSRWLKETRISKLKEEGGKYFTHLSKCEGRKIISQKMNLDAIQLKDLLLADPEISEYLVANEDNELFFQFEVFTDYILSTGDSIPIKGAIDILRVNHKDKTVQVVDFKTTHSAFEFIKSIKQYGYCDQLSFYDYLIRDWLQYYCKGKYCSYTVIEPINIVIDNEERIPYIYEYDWKDIALAADGNKEYLFSLYQTYDHNDKIKKGWKGILEEIGWHYVNNCWNKPRELYENGKIKVNLLS